MEETKTQEPIVHSMNTTSQPTNMPVSSHGNFTPVIIAIAVVLVGLGTGFLLSHQGGTVLSTKKEVITQTDGEIKKGSIYGSSDEKAFRDSTEGMLEKGGLNGEGSHKLIRPGGDSQTAYLTSSALNLDQFAGRKVKIWGETYESQKAGWFMDVGRLEVLE